MKNRKGLVGAAKFSAITFSFVFLGLFFVGYIMPTITATDLGSAQTDCISNDCICQTGAYPCCGNGIVEQYLGEQCDDGNNLNGDGCSAECAFEDACEPRTIGYWKQACKCHFNHENETSLLSYLDSVHSMSDFFDSVTSFSQICVILNPEEPATMEQRAKQQLLALWFNVASGKIFLGTQIDLGSLSSSTTVEEALNEAESLLISDPLTAKNISDTINNADHTGGVIIQCQPSPSNLTIIAHKIVCDSESDLPNWGAGGPNIMSTTAQDYVNSHPGCRLESGWKFQWAYNGVANPGDNTGEAGAGWHTFGPTESGGQATTTISDLQGTSKIWVREAWKEGYLPFSGNLTSHVSAEMYCHQDVEKYDNYDEIISPQLTKTYYCVAFNTPRLLEIPVHTCTGDGELYLYQGYPFQTINTSFAVGDGRNEVLIFAWNSEKAKLFAYVDGSPTSMNLLNNPADSYSIYSIPVSPGSTVSIKGWCKPESTELGARCVQGFLAQDSSNPVYDPGTLQMIYDDERSNDMYLLPDTYSYVFFDKYTENGPGQGNDTRKLTVTVNGPGGLILNQTYNQPSPYPTQGAVLGTFTASEEGNHTVKLSTEDSIYWVYDGCPAPYCGDGIINQPGEECEPPNTDTCDCDCHYKELTCVEAKNLGLLTGSISGGSAHIVNNANQAYDVGLAVYKKFDEIIDNQVIFDYDTGTVGAQNSLDLTVGLPDCKYQIDLFCGPVLMSLNGTRYGERLINATHAGTQYCSNDFCGDGIVKSPEQCELPGTNNNQYCTQTTSQCSGYKLGTRDAYGNCNGACGCTYDNFTYACVQGQCGAVCDSNDDCANKCVGSTRYFNSVCNTCSDCQCSYNQTENCDLKDGWYNTSTYQWVSTGQCTEKEQRKREYRDYSCSPIACTYAVTSESWTDTGQTRNKPNGTSCNDNLYCTNPDVCTSGVCGGTSRNCNDGLFCTINDRCDEGQDTCLYDQRNCSGNNLPPIATCFYVPDGISFTWDYSQGFSSVCDESHDTCTQGNQTITHECSIELCNAECEDNGDCGPSECCATFNDTCTGLKLTEYNGNKIKDSTQVSNSTPNTCLGDCTCTENPVTCNPPSTQTYCVKDVCNAQCDSDDDCNDQNPNTIDTCLANCTCKHEQQFFCGDGIVKSPEQCELPNTNNNNYCSQTTSQCSGYKLGTRDGYGNCNSLCGCTYDNFTYSCVKDQCGAQCDDNSDCANKCVGNTRYYNGTCNTCSDCQCSYTTENCDLKDGWYNTSTYQWVSTGQCTEKEQRKKEYRDYSCSPSGCNYTVTSESWTDTGQTRNKANGTPCNDGLYCSDPDVCTNGICGGPSRNCNDGLYCTTNDRCDEQHDTCAYDQRDCSQYNLSKIQTCLNNPDSNPFTWDYAQGFTSVCNDECDTCTQGNQTITHECSIELCGAECEQDSDCEPYLSDSVCHFGAGCSDGCACEDGIDEYCPVPGTVVDSVCYYGTRSCTDDGCGLMNCTLLEWQICDPDEGCTGVPCDPVPAITDFWGGYSERMIHFPPGGGYDSSAKIYVPISGNFSIISASMDLEGINAIASSDIVLVTDVSGSMDDNCGPDGIAQPGETPCKINDVKNATSQFVQSVLPLSDGVNIGLVSYRTSLLGWVNLTRNETALLQEIGTYSAQGFTCISCGIRKGADIASQGEGTQKSIILLSDGAANRCIAGVCTPIVAKDEAINESRRAWEQLGVRVYVIAFADNGDLATLQQIADAGNGTLVVANVTEIIDKYKEMASIIGDSYPTDPSLDIGNSGAIDWSYAGEFSTSETLSDFVSKLDSIRQDCNCTGCSIQSNVCVIDLYTYSSSLGIIRFYNLNITACCYGGGAACCVPETNGSTELFCGDGSCNNGETCSNCPTDCGQCPPQCGDGVCDSGESCHSCSADCGGCGGNGGGGGGGCTPNWTCTEWTPCCEDATQKRMCTDLNNCGTLAGKPAEIKSCIFIQALTSGFQGCMPGSQMCDKGSLLECTSENKWVKVSSCGTETSGGSENPESSGPLDQSIAGMFMLGSWPYLLVIIAAFFLFLTRGGMKKINGNGKPAFAAGKKMRKGSKGSK